MTYSGAFLNERFHRLVDVDGMDGIQIAPLVRKGPVLSHRMSRGPLLRNIGGLSASIWDTISSTYWIASHFHQQYFTLSCACLRFAYKRTVISVQGSIKGTRAYGKLNTQTQYRFWGPKLIIYITLLITAFYMPNESFITYGKASGFFAAGFILVQLVLLIDCAYRFRYHHDLS
jgi:hypothetical protein